jgi:hypothetical protein
LIPAALLLLFLAICCIGQVVVFWLTPRDEASNLNLLSKDAADYRPWRLDLLLPPIAPQAAQAEAADRATAIAQLDMNPTPVFANLPTEDVAIVDAPVNAPTSTPADVIVAVAPTVTPRPTAVATVTPAATAEAPGETVIAAIDTPTSTPALTPTPTGRVVVQLPPTNTPTWTPTDTPPVPATNTPTNTPRQPTAKPTDTPTTVKPTDTPTTVKPTNTPTTVKSTDTPTNTPIVPATNTPTDTPTNTRRPTNTPTKTPTITPTSPTDTPTNTPTDIPTNTPTNTRRPTNTPTDTPTNTPTDIPTNTPTDTPTNTPTSTPTDTPTQTPPSCTPVAGQLQIVKIASNYTPQVGEQVTFTICIMNRTNAAVDIREITDGFTSQWVFQGARCDWSPKSRSDLGCTTDGLVTGGTAAWGNPNTPIGQAITLQMGEDINLIAIGAFNASGQICNGPQNGSGIGYVVTKMDNSTLTGNNVCVDVQ